MPAGPAEKRAASFALVSGSSVAAQYLSVKPSQPLVALNVIVLLLLDGLVALLLQALVAEHADEALVQDVVAVGLRRAVARDQRVGEAA